ncbi:LPS translocon maturation chaperone LptM [Rhodoferax bucti]|uniref:LPS translocon maturation chaperone LptM n=1 Tax=Rhodoferax bucti TaxID=2576305 RepID=UPI0011085259|nr:lipoprotein [Rhodoferax bucti]
MLNRSRILVSGLIPLMCVLSLGACGQTGPLYLPKVPAKVAPSSSPSSPPLVKDTAPTTP